MADETGKIDANNKVVSMAVTDDTNKFIKMLRIDDVSKGLKVTLVGGTGTGSVTSVSVTTANGVSGTVATATTTPAITLTLGAITPTTLTPSGLATFKNTVQTITAIGALALDGSLGNMFTKTIATGSTFTQSNFSVGQNFIVTVSGAFTITWFSGVTWLTVGASAPTQGALTSYGFTCTGSNSFLGYLVGTQ